MPQIVDGIGALAKRAKPSPRAIPKPSPMAICSKGIVDPRLHGRLRANYEGS